MTQVLYNGIDPFSGIAGEPLVSINDSFIKYGEQWGVKDTITLNGTITGGCNFFNDIISGQNSLVQAFSQDFQSLQILESGLIIFNKPYCIIKGVNFPESRYLKVLPFSIEIDCYESGFFSGVYGILEPKNEFNFILEKDQSIHIEHSMSCRGFNTSSTNSNALQNARNFISQLSGFNYQITPYFIQICSGINPSLMQVSENIDRVIGTYSVTETYVMEKEFASGVLRYITTFDSGIENGISTVKVNGSLKTAKNYPISILQGRYSGFDAFSRAVECYSGSTLGRIDLNPFYLTSGITEDQLARTLNFDITFNNDQTPNPYIDYKIDFSEDFLTSVTTAKFEGVVKGRGELSQRWLAVQAFATGINMYAMTAAEYYNDGYLYTLNPYFISQSISKNPFTAEISLSASYNDKPLPPTGFAFFDYNIDVTPSIEKYSAIPLLCGSGNYYVSDLGYTNRSIIKIAGQAVIDPSQIFLSGIFNLEGYINYLMLNNYVTGSGIVLEGQSIIEGNKNIGLNIGFESIWSMYDIRFNP